MRHSRVMPSESARRLEESAQVVLVAMVLAKLALTLDGRPSLVLSLLVLVESVGGLFYYWRVRPRWAAKSASKSTMPSISASSRERFRLVACMSLAALTGAGALTALGLDSTIVGAVLVVITGGLLALMWSVPWPFR